MKTFHQTINDENSCNNTHNYYKSNVTTKRFYYFANGKIKKELKTLN